MIPDPHLTAFAARLCKLIAAEPLADAPLPPFSADDAFNAEALELFALQFDANRVYRLLCEARGTPPASVNHWTRIPALPTTAFKAFEVTCLPPEDRVTAFHSSGTTGHQPSRHFHSPDSLALYELSLWQWFQPHLVPDLQSTRAASVPPDPRGFHLCVLTPSPTQAPHSSLVHMFEVVRERLGAPASVFAGRTSADGAWTLDGEALLQRLHGAVATEQPLLLLGTAFSFVQLLDAMSRQGAKLQLPPGSRIMETGGYKGRTRTLARTELHALLRRHLGVSLAHIISEYGMSELSSQAYDLAFASAPVRPQPRVFQFPPWARSRVVSVETGEEVRDGESGLLQVFDLANVFSVMAVQTEDLAIRRGTGIEWLGRAASVEPRGCSLMASS